MSKDVLSKVTLVLGNFLCSQWLRFSRPDEPLGFCPGVASLWNNNICNLNSLKVPISLCTKLRLAARFRPDSLGELTALHRPLSCIGKGEEEGEGDGKGGRGREGRRGEGRAGERKMNETRMLFA